MTLQHTQALPPTQLIFRVVLNAAMLAALCACSRPSPPESERLPEAKGSTITFPNHTLPADIRMVQVGGNSKTELQIPGRLGWDEDHTARIFAPYAGRIERVLVVLGQTVRRGDAVAEVGSSDVGQAQADLHKAQADEALAHAAAERARELGQAGVIARKDLQQAEADLARTTAELERARARLNQYGVVTDTITQSITLKTPISGVIVERNASTQTEVRSDIQGLPLFTISDPTTLWATLDIDERDIGAVRPDQTVTLHAQAWPDVAFPATITSISSSVDPNSRTVKVRARVPNPERRLKAEMFVTAHVARPSSLLSVSADAVLLKGEKLFVFVQKSSGQLERREIKARGAGVQAWFVEQGIEAGDSVAIGGVLYLDQLLGSAQ